MGCPHLDSVGPQSQPAGYSVRFISENCVEARAKDLIVSYKVHHDGVHDEEYAALIKALGDGYRILEVFTDTMGDGPVVVTAVLTTDYVGSAYQRRKEISP